MERLTEQYWRNLDPWECCGQDNFCQRGCHDLGGCTNGCIVPKLYARLAAYEDTGLEPEEVKLLANVLQEVGETYNCWFNFVANCVLENSHIKEFHKAEKAGRLVVLPCKVGDVLYSIFFGRIVETKVRSFCIGHPSHRVEKCDLKLIRTDRWDIQMDNIGKTVFLTREEAEEALKKKGENNEQNKN